MAFVYKKTITGGSVGDVSFDSGTDSFVASGDAWARDVLVDAVRGTEVPIAASVDCPRDLPLAKRWLATSIVGEELPSTRHEHTLYAAREFRWSAFRKERVERFDIVCLVGPEGACAILRKRFDKPDFFGKTHEDTILMLGHNHTLVSPRGGPVVDSALRKEIADQLKIMLVVT